MFAQVVHSLYFASHRGTLMRRYEEGDEHTWIQQTVLCSCSKRPMQTHILDTHTRSEIHSTRQRSVTHISSESKKTRTVLYFWNVTQHVILFCRKLSNTFLIGAVRRISHTRLHRGSTIFQSPYNCHRQRCSCYSSASCSPLLSFIAFPFVFQCSLLF